MTLLNGLNQFGEILRELMNAKLKQNNSMENKCRLKFRKLAQTGSKSNDNIIKDLKHFLSINLSIDEYQLLSTKLDQQSNDHEQICELIIKLIHYTEKQIDWNGQLFEEVLNIIGNIITNANLDQDYCAESAIDKCSLLIYDSFQIIKCLRNKIVNVCKSYPVPVYYDNVIKLDNTGNEQRLLNLDGNNNGNLPDNNNNNNNNETTKLDSDQCTNVISSISLRQSLMNTFQNLQTLMIDFHILADALYFVRHFDDIMNHNEPVANDKNSQKNIGDQVPEIISKGTSKRRPSPPKRPMKQADCYETNECYHRKNAIVNCKCQICPDNGKNRHSSCQRLNKPETYFNNNNRNDFKYNNYYDNERSYSQYPNTGSNNDRTLLTNFNYYY